MFEKIKSVLGIFFRGTFSSGQGLLGGALIIASFYLVFGLFTGVASFQNYFKNKSALNKADDKIAVLQKDLDLVNHHIKLLQEYSPDFVSEMGAKYLNLGDPNIKIIKK